MSKNTTSGIDARLHKLRLDINKLTARIEKLESTRRKTGLIAQSIMELGPGSTFCYPDPCDDEDALQYTIINSGGHLSNDGVWALDPDWELVEFNKDTYVFPGKRFC